ncbi:MAG TPA: Flp pilus assembly protein CpaB [Candidatus Limnocylindria bacterium]|nr:Flp pilus assembly protein CpaB [Candidatus Limnocylindria bacterium]
MTRRRLALAVAVVAALAAAVLYVAAAQRTAVIVASRDLDALAPIAAEDVAVASYAVDSLPPGALQDPGAVLGRYVSGPVAAGQPLVRSSLRASAPLFQTGLLPPVGTRAVAVPVDAANALGGAVAPGSHVDIVAIPVRGRAPDGRGPELVARGALVLDVRSGSGRPFGRAASGTAAYAERIGSVVVAIAVADELRFAERVATSTFVLLLAVP